MKFIKENIIRDKRSFFVGVFLTLATVIYSGKYCPKTIRTFESEDIKGAAIHYKVPFMGGEIRIWDPNKHDYSISLSSYLDKNFDNPYNRKAKELEINNIAGFVEEPFYKNTLEKIKNFKNPLIRGPKQDEE